MKYALALLAMLGLFVAAPASAQTSHDVGTQTQIQTPAPAQAASRPADGSGMDIQHLTVDGHILIVEMAVTEAEQVHGLMDRTSLATDHGMLFLFPDLAPRTFWMKDTLIPLDMLFIDDHGKIINIHRNAKPQDLTSIPSDGPVLAVLELAGGSAGKLHIKTGDVIHGKDFHN